MTTSTIETAARRRLNAISSSFWSSTEIIEDCLYFALMDMCARVKCYEATATDTSVASTASYSLPDTAIELKQVVFDGRKLEVMPERQYFSMNLNTATAAVGTPTHYFLWGSSYILYPTPDTSSLTIQIRYTSNPGVITTGSTIPVPSQFHPRLVNGVCYYMLLKETDDPRIPVYEARWMRDLQDSVDEWRRRKHADKYPLVRTEETLLTNDTGIV